MSLSTRRTNVPSFSETLPTFQLHTPNRSVHPIRSIPSTDSLASYSTTETRNTLPQYVAEEDDNPDVITTSIEIDPDADDDDDDDDQNKYVPQPPLQVIHNAVVSKSPSTATKRIKTRSGLAKLFSRNTLLPSTTTTPGVRLTTKSRMLKSVSKDVRLGFPLAMPIIDGRAVVDNIDSMTYCQFMSRINILLAAGAVEDVRLLLESQPAFGDHVSLVKLADMKHHAYETITVHDISSLTTDPHNRGDEMTTTTTMAAASTTTRLTVPELDPTREDSDDCASDYTTERRGSVASFTSVASSKSSLSARIRSRFEKKEEWCLVFD